MKKYFFILCFFLSISAFATHERAGEISYKHISGNTYEISITTYTKGSSTAADRCFMTIFFGSGATDTAVACRSNYEPGDPSTDGFGATCTGSPDCSTHHMGEWTIGNPSLYNLDIKKNVYTITHTFPGPGVYVISMSDPNRNEGIVNVPPLTALSVQDTLIITNTPGMPTYNNSVILTNPPIDNACVGNCFIHNPRAVDPDGDSISYKLGRCFQERGVPIPSPGYFIPPGITVDAYTGDLSWCNPPPQVLGSPYTFPYEYNYAMDVEEWKLNTITKKRYLIGTVRRDMQVKVYDCKNKPPIISKVIDTCLQANTNLTLTVTATDPGNNVIAVFSANGDPFKTVPAASFVSDAPLPSPSTGTFSWTPTCNQVRIQPYLVTFKALDDGAPDNVPLSDFKTFHIRVIAPAPENLTATPKCTNMILHWDAPLCNPSANPLFKYKIYRKIGCDTLKPGYCDTGIPTSWGYQLIATIPNTKTSYTDNSGLIQGNVYSYRVVAYYLDGAESYVSAPICSKLLRDVPIITNVDVLSTDSINGSIHINWVKPIADSANFDTTLSYNKGPYRFDLLSASGYGNPVPPATATFGSPFFGSLNTTSYSHTAINTEATPFTYRIEFYSDSNHCPTQNASSVFLSCNPNDNQIQISWNEQVPWTNYQYDIYRLNTATKNWDSIATTTGKTYTDTALTNGVTYCYKVKSIGAYPDTTLPHPLINWSQELCCVPVDLTPPCPSKLTVLDSSCAKAQIILKWTNPNDSCSKDALYYILYHNDSLTGDFAVMDTIRNINTTTFLSDSLFSIAGCYVITSVDSAGNESKYSNQVCIDNCPSYILPNVFTPDGNGTNDYFTPLHPYKYINSIDIRIYDRWGVEVFHTHDPEIMWNGKSEQTKLKCSEGVYYYVCIVHDIRLKGLVSHVLKGYVQLLRK